MSVCVYVRVQWVKSTNTLELEVIEQYLPRAEYSRDMHREEANPKICSVVSSPAMQKSTRTQHDIDSAAWDRIA